MSDYIISAIGLVNAATKLMMALAVLVFFVGIVKFMTHAGDESKQKEGKNVMLWGLVTLFVMLSTWGLVQLLQMELGITGVTKYGENANFSGENVFRGKNDFGSSTIQLEGSNDFGSSPIQLEGRGGLRGGTYFQGQNRLRD